MEAVIRRNQSKGEILFKLRKTGKINGIPYRIYFNSCNLEHVLYGELKDFSDEEKEAIPLCLVDFETLEIHPVQNRYIAYFIRDYWVELDFEEDEIRMAAFYLPER